MEGPYKIPSWGQPLLSSLVGFSASSAYFGRSPRLLSSFLNGVARGREETLFELTGPMTSGRQGVLMPSWSQGFREDGRGSTESTEDPVLGGCGSWGSKWKDPGGCKVQRGEYRPVVP